MLCIIHITFVIFATFWTTLFKLFIADMSLCGHITVKSSCKTWTAVVMISTRLGSLFREQTGTFLWFHKYVFQIFQNRKLFINACCSVFSDIATGSNDTFGRHIRSSDASKLLLASFVQKIHIICLGCLFYSSHGSIHIAFSLDVWSTRESPENVKSTLGTFLCILPHQQSEWNKYGSSSWCSLWVTPLRLQKIDHFDFRFLSSGNGWQFWIFPFKFCTRLLRILQFAPILALLLPPHLIRATLNSTPMPSHHEQHKKIMQSSV